MGTLISAETNYNTDANTKTIRYTYQSFEDFGDECLGLANQQYRVRDGVFEYSGEVIYFWGGTSGGGNGGGGGGDPTGDNSPLLEVSSAATAEPIEAHPYFDNIAQTEWDKWNRWKANPEDPILKGVAPMNSRGFFDPAEAEVGTKLADLYALYFRGVKEYFEPKVVIRQTRFEAVKPALQYVGKISTPPIDPGGMANYILNTGNGKYDPRNGTWENTYEWIGSRKGWPATIYGI